MIDRDLKRCLGQMIKGVQVVSATHEGVTRAYCSHWLCQVSFDEPIVLASMSPKHDTYPLVLGSGRFTVSILAADQADVGQYFSYPGRRFRHIAEEYLETIDGHTVVPKCIAWFGCEVIDRSRILGGRDGFPRTQLDHELVYGRVTAFGEGRLGEPPLLYSSRLGWRATGGRAREEGASIRDRLLARLADPEGDR
jgi:flavin reductase (DIM6/NTAB) family NADH-FMN oxidoreductase RutF